jgi:alanyl-tRNA synthetase
MKADEIQKRFLKFFEAHGHTAVPSASLVPDNDPTLLFTGAGMNPFKEKFLGRGLGACRRAASVQRCLRTGDIEKVGRTSGHHTFFEMLGNFSFGDYFKEEAILRAWEFLTEELKLPAGRLEVSVFQDDDEAYRLWKDGVGLPAERIHRFGDRDNFWPAGAPTGGPDGPCGPCSEIFYDQGREYSCGAPDCGVNCGCGRYVEIWNLVFTQYDRQGDGSLKPLPQKNIDTGMGLERIAAVMQGCRSNFDTDLFKPLVAAAAELAGRPYEAGSESGARMRRIADHARAAVFCVADGVLPSNEGRGYVLRRLIRRAVRDGMELGIERDFLHELSPLVVEVMGRRYAHLREQIPALRSAILQEEVRFRETLKQGLHMLGVIIEKMKQSGERVLGGEEAFRLYDTYGFPLDMAEGMLKPQGIEIDRAGFEREMERQRSQSRSESRIGAAIFTLGPWSKLKGLASETKFIGYTKLQAKCRVLAMMGMGSDGKEETILAQAGEGREVSVLLDKTPFYAEGGGQLADQGRMRWSTGEAQVIDVQRADALLVHRVKVTRGTLVAGETVQAEVDARRRQAVARNHTATHLLHAALRELLGEHVRQAGSLVAPDRLRFDVTHASPLSDGESAEVEALVNEHILEDVSVSSSEMSLEEARGIGAMALFGEKYGDRVRVVQVGSFSQELCGGTHVRTCGQIGPFLIQDQGSVGAGLRRVEAVTGFSALHSIREDRQSLRRIAEASGGGSPQEWLDRYQRLKEENKNLQKTVGAGQTEARLDRIKEVVDQAPVFGGTSVIHHHFGDGYGPAELRRAADWVRGWKPSYAFVGSGCTEGGGTLLVALSEDLVGKGLRADEVVRQAAAVMDGQGGGKPALAQAGGKEIGRLPQAVETARKAMEAFLKGTASVAQEGGE